ncbi:BAF_HP2_G0039830.mRNA.1.CDS.1 [Saccharomyces cerevisiae]|nr:BAF_HP2_G0039830.mRNA.1.CDS.1 [Saccharomyces cerevisiae]CAI6627340.1 BAF_HP2_G0039830.mRNA.1.CDS.1 [Saccharomyces cerevisiae]
MVLLHKKHTYISTDFASVSRAFLIDTPIHTPPMNVDQEGKFAHNEAVEKVRKAAHMGQTLLRGITETWIIEVSVVNPANSTMKTYTRNLDHTGIMKVEEYTTYQFDSAKSRIR